MTVTLILLALKSLLVAAVTLCLLRLTHRRSASERSTIAHLGLFALVALPLGSLVLPTLALPVPIASLTGIGPVVNPQPDLPVSGRASLPSPPTTTTASAASGGVVSGTLADTIVPGARYAFLLPSLLLFGLTLVALLRLVGLRARAEILVDPVWLSALARAQRRMGFKNGTALLWSNELGSPVSWGLMRPIILLSDTALDASDQAEAIIAHELAHVVHLDWVKLILARVATAAFWFNPLAWVLAREAHQLREEAADDAVLAANIAAPDYAELLIGVARHQCRGTLLGAHGVAPSKSSLGRRVQRVLDQSPARGPSARSWVAGFATGMLGMTVPLAAITIVPTPTALAVGKASGGVASLDGSRASRPTLTPNAASRRAPIAGAANTASRRIDPGPAVLVDNPGDGTTLDGLGVTDIYRREMAEAGFSNLSLGQLDRARALGVTPAYARAMRATGMEIGFDVLIQARADGLDPSYVAAMRGVGVKGTLNDYQRLRAVGVTIGFVQKLRRSGIAVTAPDELARLRANADPDP